MRFDNTETELDLKDLFGRILIGWKTGFIVALACAVAFAGYALIKSEKEKNKKPVYEETSLAAAVAALNSDEKEEADRTYAQYLTYFRLLDFQRKHEEHSVLMTLNPETAVSKTRQYLVRSSKPGILDAVQSFKPDRDAYKRISDYIGDADYADYADELVTVDRGISAGVMQLAAAATGDEAPAMYDTTLCITVIGGDESFCNALLDAVDRSFGRYIDGMKGADESVTYEVAGETVLTDNRKDITDRQKKMLDATAELVTQRKNFLTNTVNKLSAAQQTYIGVLGLRDDVKEPEETKGRGMVKMAVIGFALGLVIYMGVIFMIYLFAGLVRTPRELESALGVRMMRLAGVKESKAAPKWDFIRRWGEKLVNSERALSAGEAAELTCAELAATDGKGFFALSCDGPESLAGTFASGLVRVCSEAGCDVKTGDPLEDRAALEALLASNGVLAVVGVDQSRRARIFDALRLAADHEIPVMGYVSVR